MGKEVESSSSQPPQTAAGVIGLIAKKDGVIGVLLLAVVYMLYHNGNQARADREKSDQRYELALQRLDASHQREFTLGSQAVEVIRVNTEVVKDNTRVMKTNTRALEKRFGKVHNPIPDGDDG